MAGWPGVARCAHTSKRPATQTTRVELLSVEDATIGGMASEVMSIAARLDALGYEVQADDNVISIYDTRVWWRWPTGDELCVVTPSVVTHRADAFWPWIFERPWSGSTSLVRLRSEDGVDPCDHLLTHLRPPGEIATVVCRSPFDVPFDVEVPGSSVRPEGVSTDWWQAWHEPSLRARIRLATARLRYGDSRQVQPGSRLLEMLYTIERRLGRSVRSPDTWRSY